ncbi:MAG: DUF3520 domain-containing protein [Gammaproteobacteria bacterium]|nr:DUF3520 domain-containing protein [Gammaproteobacteria bacterium]NKB63181.1 DUF3520 domain-containing protein [Gammaproteobacteria bacterium]
MKFPIQSLLIEAVISIVGCTSESGKKQPQIASSQAVPQPLVKPVATSLMRPRAKMAGTAMLSTAVSAVTGRQGSVSASPVFTPALEASLPLYSANAEKYLNYPDNPVKSVIREPISTFSVDVDTAAYSNIRRMLDREGRMPPSDAIRVEELINYFDYDYQIPEALDTPFSLVTEIAPAPWNDHRYLLQIGLKGYEPIPEKRPNANLVFLVDVSGSMQSADKLPLLKRSLSLLVNRMTEQDQIALVVYAGAAGLVLDSTSVQEKYKILDAIEGLESGGSTNGGAGIQLAYDIAAQNYIESGINRVIIASDGDMNVGLTDHGELIELVERKRQSGIALTTLGFGAGNYNYALMEQLADVGNGNAAYIDLISEAQKVLVNEMNSTLLTIAKDVKIQIEFNPNQILEYRLIGYENRMLNQEDFKNDKVDAGDIGAGHTVTAFYEITPAGSDYGLLPQSRYEAKPQSRNSYQNEIAFIRLRFKQPDGKASREIIHPVTVKEMKPELSMATDDFRFASAVAGFGQLLKNGKHMGDWNLEQAIELARNARGEDSHGYRSGFIRLAELANSIGTL